MQAVSASLGAVRVSETLRESTLLGIQLDAPLSAAAALFDLRPSFASGEVDTGLIIARGLLSSRWQSPKQDFARMARAVVDSYVSEDGMVIQLVVGMHPETELILRAQQLVLLSGVVPGLPEAPPDYVSDKPDKIAAGEARWHSAFIARSAISIAARQ